MMLRALHVLTLIAALLVAGCGTGPAGGTQDAGPVAGSGGAGPYTQCLCEAEMQAYLDLSFVGLADTVTGTITTRQDSVILRLEGVHWAPFRTFSHPLTAGSTISVYLGPPARPNLPADFAPWGSIGRFGRLWLAPFGAEDLSTLAPGQAFFGMLSGESRADVQLRVAALRPTGDPVCDPFGHGEHQPMVLASRRDLVALLQSRPTWQDAWVACIQKLEETGGPSVGPLDYYPGP
jgi:hypothetical protein